MIKARTENLTAQSSWFTQAKFTTLFKCFDRTFSVIFLMLFFSITSCIVVDMYCKMLKVWKIKPVNAKLGTVKPPRESNLGYLSWSWPLSLLLNISFSFHRLQSDHEESHNSLLIQPLPCFIHLIGILKFHLPFRRAVCEALTKRCLLYFWHKCFLPKKLDLPW